jgi:hypothetical protein
MTPVQLAAVKLGDAVTLHETTCGRVSQSAPSWFMVSWEDSDPQIVTRAYGLHGLEFDLPELGVQRCTTRRWWND